MVSTWHANGWGNAYKRPTKVSSVEMDEPLKAGHSVELEREMQSCAIAIGDNASMEAKAALLLTPPILRVDLAGLGLPVRHIGVWS